VGPPPRRRTCCPQAASLSPTPAHPQILQLKEALEEKEGIHVLSFKLLHAGKSLGDAATLESAKIEAGAVLHMVLAFRGSAAE